MSAAFPDSMMDSAAASPYPPPHYTSPFHPNQPSLAVPHPDNSHVAPRIRAATFSITLLLLLAPASSSQESPLFLL